MAPTLAASQHEVIRDMVVEGSLTNAQMSTVARCSRRTISSLRANLRHYGSTHAPYNGRGGRPRSITPPMLDALLCLLREKPDLHLDEMAIFLWDNFQEIVTISTISRSLASAKWSKKVARQTSKDRNADLRDVYLHDVSAFSSYHLVFVDESGCDTRVGYRRRGWSPLGVTPVQIARFQRGQRYHILPAYTQNGVLFSRVYQGMTDSVVFEGFIEQLLHHCGRWPEPTSVLVMDNASFHRGEKIQRMCENAGVKLLYLPPYSPDLNPIEEYFAELKAFVRKNWSKYEQSSDHNFGAFLQWCVDMVGRNKKSAHGHFRHAGWTIEELGVGDCNWKTSGKWESSNPMDHHL